MTNEQLHAELLPCPFCGESDNLIVQHCEGTIIHPAYRIYCDNCGGSNGYTDRGDHVEDWNRRAALQSPEIEALREDAERYRWLRTQCEKQIGGLTKSLGEVAIRTITSTQLWRNENER